MPPEFVQALQDMSIATAIRESALVFPVILSLHLTGMGLFGGMILMTDLRLLGLALQSRPVSDVVGQLRLWKWIGFIIMVTCGILLATSEADKYYGNPYFQLKMLFLLLVGVHALVFRRSVYGNTAALDRAPKMPGVAKVAATLSLVLWIGVLSLGRWIAYYEPPKEGRKPVAAATLHLTDPGQLSRR
jgi:hypothetical protein